MYYIKNHNIKEFKSYCQNKCQEIILINKSKKDIGYYRGSYKGYSYGIKISNYILLKKININKSELYRLFKNQIFELTDPGTKKSFYSILNFISNLKQ